MMLCPICQKNPANRHAIYGVLPCASCRPAHVVFSKQVEFTTGEMKQNRKKYAGDVIQPFRDGHLSKEYVKAYGTKNLEVSETEVKNAGNVWGDLNYYQDK